MIYSDYVLIEKYRPRTIEECILPENIKKEFESYVLADKIPNLILAGTSGTGKTTCAYALANELGYDNLYINGSNEGRSIDTLRGVVTDFASSMSLYSNRKVIIIDEADGIPNLVQEALKSFIEEYATVCSFILTCVTGDTKVYTPYGCKTIDSVQINDKLLSFNDYNVNKNLIKKLSKDVYNIKTIHGYEINATSNHKFYTLSGGKYLSDFTLGDRIPVKINHLIGNSHEYESNDGWFDYDEFYKFIQNKKILTNDELNYIKNNIHFSIGKSNKKIHQYILDNNITEFNVDELSSNLGIKVYILRNYITRVLNGKYVICKKYLGRNYSKYFIDIEKMRQDYGLYLETIKHFIKIPQLNTIRNYRTVENLLDELPKFNDQHILSLGRLVGFLEGDGHLTKDMNMHFSADKESVLTRVKSDIYQFKDVTLNIRKNGKNTNGLSMGFSDKALAYLFEYLGATVGNKSKTCRKLSKFSKNKLFFKGFMQGFYDSDGNTFKISKDRDVSPFTVRQSIYNETQLDYFKDIADKMKLHFDVDLQYSVNLLNQDNATYNTSILEMKLYTGTLDNLIKYFEQVGSFYEVKTPPPILAYMRYKVNNTLDYIPYTKWLETYWASGYINDKIKSITKIEGEIEVYDCSFDDNHWYITNGFVSHNCNNKSKLIPALISRFVEVNFVIPQDQKSKIAVAMMKRIMEILTKENVKYEKEAIAGLVKRFFPDFRRTLNELQRYATGGEFMLAQLANIDADINLLIKNIKDKNFTNTVEVIEKMSNVDISSIVEELYKNKAEYSSANDVPIVIKILSDYLDKASRTSNPKITCLAMIADIMCVSE